VSKPTTLPEHVTRDEDRAISRRDMMLRTAAAGFASCASIHAAGSLSSRDQRNPARSLNEMPHDMPQELGTDMSTDPPLPRTPFTILLGIAQDGGVPQAGSFGDPRWDDRAQRKSVVSLGIVDPASGRRWIIDATPDFPRQLLALHRASVQTSLTERPPRPAVDGVFLTHAHIGHYPGLMYLGKESIGASRVPTYAMPRMREFLEKNGPWSQLVALENIALAPLVANEAVEIADGLRVTPILVPHRAEFSETVAFRIATPSRAVLWLPDIDSWRAWDDAGTRLEDVLATVDVAYLDGCFFTDGELPGRDMSKVPHPLMTDTIARLAALPATERAKVRFIHLNHTNPALDATSDAARVIRDAGMHVAEEGEIVPLANA
jgi:pyrroloquinoline quinone biosynthesis protein B